MKLILIILCILTGMGLSIEAGFLGPLGKEVGELWATFSIFSLGSVLALICVLVFPSKLSFKKSDFHWRDFIGGPLGVGYVVVLTVATPVIGVAMTMIGILSGQIIKSIVIDHYGLFGVAVRPVNIKKLLALSFMGISLYFTWQG